MVQSRPMIHRARGAGAVLCIAPWFLAIGCDTSDTEVRQARANPQPPASERAGGSNAPASSEPKQASSDSEAEEAEPPVAYEVRYGLATHLERAELRHQGALVADLGVPGGAKYTLGGWQTGVGSSRIVDGTSVAIVPGDTGRFLLPSNHAGARTLSIRARAVRDGRMTVHVNGEAVADARLSPDALETLEVELDEGTLEKGDNVLQLRVRGPGRLEGVGRAGIAVDWFRLGPAKKQNASPPPAPGQLKGKRKDTPALSIPKSWSLGYALEVPEKARLRGVVLGSDGARLQVVAHRDAGPPIPVGSVDAKEHGARLDLDLAELAGSVARLDLEAHGGEVELVRPAVAVPERENDRGEPSSKPRNVLVFLIDTLRADKLSPYNGDTPVETPGLEAFAKDAAVFEQGHAEANWTKPSVATLLSSLYPWQHHATRGESVVPRSVRLLPEVLRDEGYFTGAFIANGYVSGKFGFRRGWDTWRNYIREGRRTPAEYVASDAIEWLKNRRPEDEPFFLYVQTIDPHVPYIPPDSILKDYFDEPYRGPVNFVRDRQLLGKVKTGSLKLDEQDKRRLEALHDAEIAYHDKHFARVMNALEEQGLADDTLVLVTSDHGEEFFDHGSVGHGHSVWEELLHVPYVMRVPGWTDGGMRIEQPVGLVDVMPTVLDLLGVEGSDRLQGHSLSPLLEGKSRSAPRPIVSGFHKGWRTALVGSHKLIQRTWQNPALYDLGEDPGETEDLQQDRPVTLRYLRGMLGLALAGHEDAEAPTRNRARARKQKSPRDHEPEETDIDPETKEQLRALGYVH